MIRLYLLRHAHAEDHTLSFSDFDRPLDERGRKEARAVADYVYKNEINFDLIMCSAALRAQETLEPLRTLVGTDAILIGESFYNISDEMILDHLKRVSDEKHTVLYIGHNPGVAFSVLKFSKGIPTFLQEGIMPATLIGFEFPIDKWEDLNWGEGKIIDVFQPPLLSSEVPGPQEP
jgi:phosphohistidine phosphatase